MHRTRLALIVAIALGLLGDQILRAPHWGLNLAILLVALSGAAFLLNLSDRSETQGARLAWAWPAAAFFAGMWAVRDAESLRAVDLLAALALLALPFAGGAASATVGVVEVCAAQVRAAWASVTGGPGLLAAAAPSLVPRTTTARRAGAVAAGLLLGLPFVLIFGALFASADPLFDAALASVLDAGLRPLLSHAGLAGVLAWTTAGYLGAQVVRRSAVTIDLPTLSLGSVPVITALGATAAVFTLFLATQAGSLFGGEAFVQDRTGLTYAQYARQGFFQLVFASALTLPMVYAAPFVAAPKTDGERKSLHAMLAVQLGLTALVLASALWRLALYMRVYGLTEDRVNGTAILIWIAGTIAVFAFTVARGRPGAAVLGSIGAAIGALSLLNLANPHALIARYNLAHQERRPADVAHLVLLGQDALPVLAERFPDIPAAHRCWVADQLVRRQGAVRADWRGWSLARSRAREPLNVFRTARNGCSPEERKTAPPSQSD